jgi:2-phosphoglycerate kinase
MAYILEGSGSWLLALIGLDSGCVTEGYINFIGEETDMKANNIISSIYWLGGSTCAGKTTISNILSEKYGLKVYHCDEHLGKHIEKSNAQEHPNLNRVTKTSWDDILSMPVEEYLKWAIGLFKEEYEMILLDIHKLYDEKPILVEGTGLLPEFFIKEAFDNSHAIWLVADKGFYRKHQSQRREMFEKIKHCSHPESALKNYMSFDLAMGKYILNDVKRLGWSVIEVGNENDIIKNAEAVSSHFKLV